MKKIIITFFAILSSINYTYADSCKIRNTSASDLLEYIDNNRIIVREITRQIGTQNNQRSLGTNINNDYLKVKGSILRVYNQAFDFNGYYSYFRFFAVYPISNEIPYEVKRDYKILESEGEGLKYLLRSITRNSKQEIKLYDLCRNIDVKCSFREGITVEEAMGKLLKNNAEILDLYRNVVIGEKIRDYEHIFLVGNNFELEIEKNYSPQSYGECSASGGGFFERINESINNIGVLNKEGKDGIQKWKDAINLLIGKDLSNEEYQRIERELLKRELSRQGIYGDNQTNMLKALDDYNSDGISKNNNFIYNTYNNTWVKIEKKLKNFKNEVIGDFFTKENKEIITISDTQTASRNSAVTNEVKQRVDQMFLELSAFETISEVDITNLRSRMLNIHSELSDSINTLDLTCQIAVEVCMEQDPSRGNCGSCN